MVRYCDSQVLERNWFEWLVASSTPSMEPLRKKNALWTNIVGRIPGSKIPDPCYQTRLHYVIPDRISFCTTNDAVDWIMPGRFSCEELEQQGYYQEPPTLLCWQAMLQDIAAICKGIANKFNQPSPEATQNLASEALVQVASKIIRGRLKYTPGRAPVFNLLTTTIHRCIYSVLSKDARQRKNLVSLTDNLMVEEVTVRRSYDIRTYRRCRVKIVH